MANCCDGFVRVRKVTHDRQDALVEPQVLGGPTSGQNQGIVLARIDRIKIRIQSKSMSRFLAVRLVTFKIVNGGCNGVSSLFVWAHGMAFVSDHQKHLKWDHDFVVFDKIANQKQDILFHFKSRNIRRETLSNETILALRHFVNHDCEFNCKLT